jgi:hypothetical protein
VSALQVLAALRRSGKTLPQLLDGVSLFPQTLINVRVEKGFDWQNHAGLKAAGSVWSRSWKAGAGADPRLGNGARGARDGGGRAGGNRRARRQELAAALRA